MAERDEHGRYSKGHKGGPGRPAREREEKYYSILIQTVTFADWEVIIKKASEQAKRGDNVARKWLADYLVGPPIERKELTGLNGGPMEIKFIDCDDEPDND